MLLAVLFALITATGMKDYVRRDDIGVALALMLPAHVGLGMPEREGTSRHTPQGY